MSTVKKSKAKTIGVVGEGPPKKTTYRTFSSADDQLFIFKLLELPEGKRPHRMAGIKGYKVIVDHFVANGMCPSCSLIISHSLIGRAVTEQQLYDRMRALTNKYRAVVNSRKAATKNTSGKPPMEMDFEVEMGQLLAASHVVNPITPIITTAIPMENEEGLSGPK